MHRPPVRRCEDNTVSAAGSTVRSWRSREARGVATRRRSRPDLEPLTPGVSRKWRDFGRSYRIQNHRRWSRYGLCFRQIARGCLTSDPIYDLVCSIGRSSELPGEEDEDMSGRGLWIGGAATRCPSDADRASGWRPPYQAAEPALWVRLRREVSLGAPA